MKKSRKQLIKDLHSKVGIVWRTSIEKEFPKLFKEDDLTKGDYWYKNDGILVLIIDLDLKVKYLPIYESIEDNRFGYSGRVCFKRKATDKEVEQALIKEAKKRGFKKGVKISYLSNTENSKGFDGVLSMSGGYLIDNQYAAIFSDGKWATVKETITKEQAEKELGKTILN